MNRTDRHRDIQRDNDICWFVMQISQTIRGVVKRGPNKWKHSDRTGRCGSTPSGQYHKERDTWSIR
jgi:hypothetical protein